jgi:hypothetical protein
VQRASLYDSLQYSSGSRLRLDTLFFQLFAIAVLKFYLHLRDLDIAVAPKIIDLGRVWFESRQSFGDDVDRVLGTLFSNPL